MSQSLDLILRGAPQGRISKDAPTPMRFLRKL